MGTRFRARGQLAASCVRYSVGDWLRTCLNTRLKWVSDWKPTSDRKKPRTDGNKISRAGSVGRELRPIFCRRLVENVLEHPVEMGERLEADFVGDLTDPQIRVEQQVLGFFNPHPRNIIGKGDAGAFSEQLAEVKTAHARGLGDLAEGKILDRK